MRSSKDHPVELEVGSTGVPLQDTIVDDDGAPVNLTGATVNFRMRPVTDTTLVADHAATVTSQTSGTVSYSWQTGDVATGGKYAGWWHVDYGGGSTYDTDEFAVWIDAHAPGRKTRTGAIADQVRRIIPVAYDVLKKDERFGEDLLQSAIDHRKFELFSTIVSPALEATSYDVISQSFCGKLAALDIIPAAADYWSDQQTQVSTTGTNESASYPDRIQHLWNVHKRLLQEIESDRMKFEAVFGWKVWRRYRVPRVSTTGPLRSADPAGFRREFRATNWYGTLPWGRWS